MKRAVLITVRPGLAITLVLTAFLLAGTGVAVAQGADVQATPETASPESSGVGQPEQQPKSEQRSEKEPTSGLKPGPTVSAEDLAIPELPEIKGFHPIKRMLRPLEQMQLITIRLHKQIMRMEGPIAALQPPMLELQKTIVRVDEKMESMGGQLNGVSEQVTHVESGMNVLREELKEIRAELIAVRKQVNALQGPLEEIREPLLQVAGPLAGLQTRLDRLQVTVYWVLVAIGLATVGIAVGTPIAAFFLHRHRHKFVRDLPRD